MEDTSIERIRALLAADEPDYDRLAQLETAALQHLREIAASDDLDLATKATYAAGRIGGSDAADLLQEASQSSHPELRVAAAGAVGGELSAEAAADVLRPLVCDDDPGVRKLALRSVADVEVSALREEVLQVAENDPQPALRELGRQAALRLGERVTLPATNLDDARRQE